MQMIVKHLQMNEQKELLVSIPDNDRVVMNQYAIDTSVTGLYLSRIWNNL